MPKEEMLEVPGTVLEILPNSMYRIHLETGQDIVAYECGKLRVRHIRIRKGDSVLVELSGYDFERGRITACVKHRAAA